MENQQTLRASPDLSAFQLACLHNHYVTTFHAWCSLYQDAEWSTVPSKPLAMAQARLAYQEASLVYLFIKAGKDKGGHPLFPE